MGGLSAGNYSGESPGSWDAFQLVRLDPRRRNTQGVNDDDRPPICPRCGVTMLPGALSAEIDLDEEWVCLECEERGEER